MALPRSCAWLRSSKQPRRLRMRRYKDPERVVLLDGAIDEEADDEPGSELDGEPPDDPPRLVAV